MTKKFALVLLLGVLLVGTAAFFTLAASGTAVLWKVSQGGSWLLPLVVVAALLDSINPCAFSILFLTIAFLFSLGTVRARLLSIGSSYIAGIGAVYLLIGLGILQTLHLFNTPHFMAKVGASLLLVLGALHVIRGFWPSFPLRFRLPHASHQTMVKLIERAEVPAAFFLGGLVGLCEFPCTGGPYLMVLGLLHDSATYLKGLGYLGLYNLIFIAPLVIVLLLASNQALLEKVQRWQQRNSTALRLGAGAAMVALGMLIFLL
ncbi:MAG: hypothetical protein HY372_02510 [Candidatus Andersenbacteria bacterium]|nr:hypothetical protein [Candidatus Andersenbacteria bacterium]